MAGFLTKIMEAVFGKKSDKDIKGIMPLVEKINAEYDQLTNLSNDELRHQTQLFKQQIADYLADIDADIENCQQQVKNSPDMLPEEKEVIYAQTDKLQLQRNEQLEEILIEILPRAFERKHPTKCYSYRP